MIVYATGFHANRYLWPMEIVGRDGAVLSEQWGDDPTAYLGITVPNFPNLFCLYGPGTNLANGGSLIFHSECQVRYVMGCLRTLRRRPTHRVDRVPPGRPRRLQRAAPGRARHDGLVATRRSATAGTATTTGGIYILSPWRLVDYWRWTREPDLADFELR